MQNDKGDDDDDDDDDDESKHKDGLPEQFWRAVAATEAVVSPDGQARQDDCPVRSW